MTSVPHSGAKSVTPGGSVAGGHTKGPWFTEYRANKRGGYSQEVFDSEGEVVATAAWFPVSLTDTTTTTNREANARLIAAAPDLLAAADAAMLFYDALGDDHRPGECKVLDDLARAIAKATAGETRNAEGAL